MSRASFSIVRAFVFALMILSIVQTIAGRFLAQMSEPEHVCSCAVDHGSCGCSICFPRLRDEESPSAAPIVKSKCGEDAKIAQADAEVYLAPASFELAGTIANARAPELVIITPRSWTAPPDTPPPRSFDRS